jgi:hypothetical protein
MATTAQSGDYLTGSTWVGGSVPANTEQIIVAAGHTLTYNGGTRTVGNDTSTAWQVNGTLKFSRSVASDLTVRGTMTISATGTLDMGTVADPITAVPAIMRINNSAAMAANKWTLTKASGGRLFMAGAERTRRTTLSSALSAGGTSMQVAAATGWQVGDELLFLPTASASSVTGQIEVRTIAAGYTPGATTVPLSSGSTVARAVGGIVANLTSNARITESDQAFGARAVTGTDCELAGVWVQDAEINLRGAAAGAPVEIGSTPVPGGYRHRFLRSVIRQSGGSLSARPTIEHGGYADTCVFLTQSTGGTSYAVLRNGGLMARSIIASTLTGQSADVTGLNNVFPRDSGDMTDCVYASSATGTIQPTRFLCTGGEYSGITILSSSSTATGPLMSLYAPGAVFDASDFAALDSPRPLFTTPVPCNGRVTFRSCRLPDVDPAYTFGNLPGFEALFTFCWRKSTPTTIIHELWQNGGVAAQDLVTRKNGTAAFKFTSRVGGFPQEYVFTAPIGAGETKTLKVNIRRDTTYGSGSMPKVTMRLPTGVEVGGSVPGEPPPDVPSSAPDVPDVWHEQTLTITNGGSSPTEVTVTLSANGENNGNAWFDGLPLQPFVPAVRWYGFVFDESNPFRAADSTITLTEAQAAAITGVAIDHTAQTITVTAARTAADVYCRAMWDLTQTANIARGRHVTSSDGASFATTYTVVIGSGGSISGRYSDANGAVVAATVTGIVAGSRILIKRTDTDVIMANAIVAGTSYSLNVQTATAIPIGVDVRKAGAAPFYQPWATTGSIDPVGGFAATANQQPD